MIVIYAKLTLKPAITAGEEAGHMLVSAAVPWTVSALLWEGRTRE